MWLRASSTNNDPRCIAQYYVDCVKENGGMKVDDDLFISYYILLVCIQDVHR